MRKPRHPKSAPAPEGLLERLEALKREGGGEKGELHPERAPSLALTVVALAERIAEVVAARLAEDLLSLPTQREGEPRSRRKRE